MNDEKFSTVIDTVLEKRDWNKPEWDYDIPEALDLNILKEKLRPDIVFAVALAGEEPQIGVQILDALYEAELSPDRLFELMEVLLPTEELMNILLVLWTICRAVGGEEYVRLMANSLYRIEHIKEVLDCLTVDRFRGLVLILLDQCAGVPIQTVLEPYIITHELRFCALSSPKLWEQARCCASFLSPAEIGHLQSTLNKLDLVLELIPTQGDNHATGWEIYNHWPKYWYMELMANLDNPLPLEEVLGSRLEKFKKVDNREFVKIVPEGENMLSLFEAVRSFCKQWCLHHTEDVLEEKRCAVNRFIRLIDSLEQIRDRRGINLAGQITKTLLTTDYLIKDLEGFDSVTYWKALNSTNIADESDLHCLIENERVVKRLCPYAYMDVNCILHILQNRTSDSLLSRFRSFELLLELGIDYALADLPATDNIVVDALLKTIDTWPQRNRAPPPLLLPITDQETRLLLPNFVGAQVILSKLKAVNKIASDGSNVVGDAIREFQFREEMDKRCHNRASTLLNQGNQMDTVSLLGIMTAFARDKVAWKRHLMLVSQIIRSDSWSEIVRAYLIPLSDRDYDLDDHSPPGKLESIVVRHMSENLNPVMKNAWLMDLQHLSPLRAAWAKLWLIEKESGELTESDRSSSENFKEAISDSTCFPYSDLKDILAHLAIGLDNDKTEHKETGGWKELLAGLVNTLDHKRLSLLPISPYLRYLDPDLKSRLCGRLNLCDQPEDTGRQSFSALSEITGKLKRIESGPYHSLSSDEAEAEPPPPPAPSTEAADAVDVETPEDILATPFILPTAISLGKTLWRSSEGVRSKIKDRVRDSVTTFIKEDQPTAPMDSKNWQQEEKEVWDTIAYAKKHTEEPIITVQTDATTVIQDPPVQMYDSEKHELKQIDQTLEEALASSCKFLGLTFIIVAVPPKKGLRSRNRKGE